ncbi:unnamed protein product, partial [Mesorhabditis belari]|uniref:glutathione transferase n=1 Tax=Mesorhabditis belari TaxID=2138241 RepID=A0AAF3EV65_9BILA
MVYKLYYFAGRGFGEPTRMLFKLAGEEFEDVRIESADWPNHKASMPMGQMPVLEVNGVKIPQSSAIARYVARKFGFAGKTPEDMAWADALVDGFKDYYKEITDYYYTALGFLNKGDAEELYKTVFLPARDKHFGMLNDRLKAQGTGFLVGDSVTWADLFWTDHMTTIEKLKPDAFTGFPEVVALKKRVDAIPQIKAWIESRPDTRF